ncbi:hypothetical protein MCOR27_004766 [Pyricularia oryzae]|uniref:Translation initiation factor 4E n=5 Tax=Pyricularia TaxID=48558 RepID=A0ABQ8NXP2_PYRGI|nr:translation initiation factor 4E [Pyricularia oryzae 70-15]ELQ44283.1 translation initiation factor 4E [Pyricularia oryzae Y34]KAH8839523.1 hypothetical protein MCOR01_008718 [Pyricularia oryzae]KAI6303104.1 hypothetical protein MCOR33_001700 [Pyricularia grisea]EHA55315.1 translation initiation factor 4E [Pyricularia oryzae 70-15]KAH9439379.1 hypothetical protein MCOR02_002937 [Pyricularia oryzae]
MAARPTLTTHGLSNLSQSSDVNSPNVNSPAESRKLAMSKIHNTLGDRPLQHIWAVWFDRSQNKENQAKDGSYQVQLEQLGAEIASIQDFWRYWNNTPVQYIKMRESIYLFKKGFKPIWEDRRNIHGGSWTFRVPKNIGPDVWKLVQLVAIGEELQDALETGDQLCGVGLSVRFNSHLISIWHRDSSKQKSIDGMVKVVLDTLPAELRPKPDNYFYKKHSDHAGFKAPPELQAVLDSQKARDAAAAKTEGTGGGGEASENPVPEIKEPGADK